MINLSVTNAISPMVYKKRVIIFKKDLNIFFFMIILTFSFQLGYLFKNNNIVCFILLVFN